MQLGGAEPGRLAEAAAIGASFGYDEINLNVGCPSDRVQQATFGACLMARPRLVADCLRAMKRAVSVPVTVKCRIGIDDHDDWPFLRDFVAAIAEAGCATVIVHARKAILKGLTPKQNRDVPPLDYARAWRVKREFPSFTVIVNGGLRTVPQVTEQLAQADGVMLGREAYHNPYLLPALHRAVFDDGYETAAGGGHRREHAQVCGIASVCRHAVAVDHATHARPLQRAGRGACLAACLVRGRQPGRSVACAHRRSVARG